MGSTYCLRYCMKTPIDQWLIIRRVSSSVEIGVSRRHAEISIVYLVKPSGLNYSNADAGIFRQSRRYRQTSSSSTNDDIVESRIGARKTEVGSQKQAQLSIRE